MTQVADVFSNRYEIERELARGGMADVFLARDQLLDRPVAVKVLFPEFARDPSFVERFRREAQSAASLNHPNIAAVYDWGQERGTYFIVMEYVEGRSLRDIIRAEGRIPAYETARVGAEIADALAFAHRHGVVHRDIKPGNVLITATGQVKLTDFGIAANPADATQGLTQTGSVMGTATYFSPEQAQGFTVDGRSDVYSLGVVMYEMVTGVPPFSGESPVAVAMKHVREVPRMPSTIEPDVPPVLESIILAAMAKSVDARYQSADDLRADLLNFQRGRPVMAAPAAVVPAGADQLAMTAAAAQTRRVAPHEPPAAPPRRWGTIIASVIGLGLLAAVVVWLLVSQSDTGNGGETLVDVPNVVAQKAADATAALQHLGFRVSQLQDEQSTQPPGTVISQNPAGGRKADKGTTIVLTVSSTTATVPTVKGQTIDNATAAIVKVGLTVNRQDTENGFLTPGTVIDTNPAAGAVVAKGSAVTVQVAVAPGIAIPDVSNKSQSAAGSAITQAGLTPKFVEVASDTVPAGTVVNTDPAAGTKVPPGSTVTVNVSNGPQQINIPNVVGQTQLAAQGTLTGAGFNVFVQQVTDPAHVGIVTAQSPAGGQAPKGTKITITVGV
jgi:eukaryotic-like serine/threonine-protein kinase